MDEIIIKMLEKWCDIKGSIRLHELTQVLHDIELKSTAEALKKHFNDSLSQNKSPGGPDVTTIPKSKPTKAPKNPKFPQNFWNTKQSNSTFKGNIYNRISKTLFRTKEAKSVKITNHLLAPLIEGAKIEGKNEPENVSNLDVSLEEEKTKRHLTDWLKKRNYIVCMVAVIMLSLVILIPLLYYAPFRSILRKHYKNEIDLPFLENVTVLINASSIIEYESAVSSYDHGGYLSVNISGLESENWPLTSKLSHSSYIKQLVVNNVTDINLLYVILQQVVNIEYLHLKAGLTSNCVLIENSTQFQNQIVYNNLTTIQFSDFSSCPPVYILTSSIIFRTLLTFELVECDIDDNNIDEIQSVMINSSQTLENITITGEIHSDRFLFSLSTPLLNAKRVTLDIKHKKILLVSMYGHKIAGPKFPETLKNLQSFENTVGIEFFDFLSVLKCTKLENLTAKVIVWSNGPFLNISSAFKGNYLDFVDLSLQFDIQCPSCKKMKLLGIESFRKRIRKKPSIVFLNCGCPRGANLVHNNVHRKNIVEQIEPPLKS